LTPSTTGSCTRTNNRTNVRLAVPSPTVPGLGQAEAWKVVAWKVVAWKVVAWKVVAW